MRILLTYHGPLDQSAVAQHVRTLATKLQADQQEIRLLTAGLPANPALPTPMHYVPLDMSVALGPPQYATDGGEPRRVGFDQLSDAELAAYRQANRAALDEEIDHWNPDIIHVQHVAIHAQLALETGVPYLCTAWGEELDLAQRDPRYLRLVEQGAENAGQILVGSRDTQQRLAGMCEGIGDRLTLVSLAGLRAADLATLYQSVLNARFG